MDLLNKNSEFPKNTSLILGFFDGVHAGHRQVIKSAVDYAKSKNTISILLTFKESPAVFFNKNANFEYIYPRETSYEIIKNLGVDYIIENSLKDFVNDTAIKYLENYLIKHFSPISISTGFNHTFGANKSGNHVLLKEYEQIFGYKYFCTEPQKKDNIVISSTYIKNLINTGKLNLANTLLEQPFQIKSKVILGQQLGHKLGFPTANMKYPKNIVKLPYGVYKVQFNNKKAILNWGIKPTVGKNEELLELHVPNFDGNLYDEVISVEILDKIRDERRFNSLDELKQQIEKDVRICLK